MKLDNAIERKIGDLVLSEIYFNKNRNLGEYNSLKDSIELEKILLDEYNILKENKIFDFSKFEKKLNKYIKGYNEKKRMSFNSLMTIYLTSMSYFYDPKKKYCYRDLEETFLQPIFYPFEVFLIIDSVEEGEVITLNQLKILLQIYFNLYSTTTEMILGSLDSYCLILFKNNKIKKIKNRGFILENIIRKGFLETEAFKKGFNLKEIISLHCHLQDDKKFKVALKDIFRQLFNICFEGDPIFPNSFFHPIPTGMIENTIKLMNDENIIYVSELLSSELTISPVYNWYIELKFDKSEEYLINIFNYCKDVINQKDLDKNIYNKDIDEMDTSLSNSTNDLKENIEEFRKLMKNIEENPHSKNDPKFERIKNKLYKFENTPPKEWINNIEF